MAAIRSLGIHQPAALQYLVEEGVLSAEPTRKEYTWETCNENSLEELGEEELVTTDHCVVYSIGGIVRKVFRFDIEEQSVQQAILTWFPTDDNQFSRPAKRIKTDTNDVTDANTPKPSVSGKIPLTASLTVRQKPGYGVQTPPTLKASDDKAAIKVSDQKRARALVVLLKHQAHVYFLGGSTNVVNLPFEVDRAFAAPRGLILQRKMSEAEAETDTPMLPSAPANSFLSPESLAKRTAPGIQQKAPRRSRGRTTSAGRASLALNDLMSTAAAPLQDEMPRHYVLTDPLADVGLICAPFEQSNPPHQSSLDQLGPLASNEEILHVSPTAELPKVSSPKRRPLIFIVTANQTKKMYCIYTATYVETMSLAEAMQRRSGSRSGSRTRRRSSFVPGTGATTPAIRLRDQPRESLSGQVPPNPTQESTTKQTAEETFAFQVDPEYQSFGQPKKESRRVSSLLSRADLATNQDRSTFHDIASGHGPTGTTFGRRGPSLGANGTRISVGGRRSFARASTPGSTFSRNSLAGSDDETVADFKESSRFSMTIEDEDEEGMKALSVKPFQDACDGLNKELVLRKVAEVPMDKPGSFSSWTKSDLLHKPQIFTLVAPDTPESLAQGVHHVCLHIMQPRIGDHVEVTFRVQEISLSARTKTYAPTLVRSRRLTDQIDALKIQDGTTARVLSLHANAENKPYLSISTCWASDMPHAEVQLPNLQVFNPLTPWETSSPSHRTTGRRRTLDIPDDLSRLGHTGSSGIFDIIAQTGKHHRLQVQLRPQTQYISTVIELCQLLLPEGLGHVIQPAWWEVMKISNVKGPEGEWQALLTVLLSLAVGHVAPPTAQKKASKARAHTQKRSVSAASGSPAVDEDIVQSMCMKLEMLPTKSLRSSAAWSWTLQTDGDSTGTSSRTSRAKNEIIVTCIEQARSFVASKTGSALLSVLYSRGADGHHDIPRLLMALHLLREEQKLNTNNKQRSNGGSWDLGPVLAQLGQWLGWEGWSQAKGSYYDIEGCGSSTHSFEDSMLMRCNFVEHANLIDQIHGYPVLSPPPADTPPSIYDWVENAASLTSYEPFPNLALLLASLDRSRSGRISKSLRKLCESLTLRSAALSQFMEKLNATEWPVTGRVELMAQCGIDRDMLETLPESISFPLKDALVRCQANPPSTWSESLLGLVGREDLKLLTDVDKDVLKLIPASVSKTETLYSSSTC